MKKPLIFAFLISTILFCKAQSWSAIGTGMNGAVYTFTVYNNNLIAGGGFSTAGGNSANDIVQWDGTSWSALGTGMNNRVNALTVYNGNLIAGGSFTTAGGNTANYIAEWNGTSWSPLGTGMNSTVSALTVYNGNLIAGGSFTTAGGNTANYIAEWNGTSWSPLGTGMNSTVSALTVYNGNLIVAGEFTTAGGSSANYIAQWNGTSWSTLGTGMNDLIVALTVCNGNLAAAGYFSSAGGVAANDIAQWNGTSWSALGSGISNLTRVLALSVFNTNLIVGGQFLNAGGVTAKSIAEWNGSSWSALSKGIDSIVDALTVYNGNIIAGGLLDSAGGYYTKNIAKWSCPFPAVISPSLIEVCKGSNIVIHASGATTYQWQGTANTKDSIVAQPLQDTTYGLQASKGTCMADTNIAVSVYPSNGFDLTGSLSVCIDTPSASNASIEACIFNNRCLPKSGTLKLLIDTAFHITTTISDSISHVKGDTLLWNYDNLSDIGKTHCVILNGSIDALSSSDSVFVTMIITPVAGDSVPENNTITYWLKNTANKNCVGAPFDPNEKSVYPTGDISVSQKLTYTISFQNTGTAVAHNIVVVDTINKYLDVTTLKVTSSSAIETTTITGSNTVKFTFDNINLPDIATSKTSSIGTVQYTIMPMSTDTAGDVIKNTAGIYFDQNSVVNTNTTVNTIPGKTVPNSIQNIEQISNNIACFPNPFTSTTSLIFNTNGTHYIEVDDVTGRRIKEIECNGKQYELSRNGLAAGIYFIKASDANQNNTAITKIVVQ